MKIQSKEILKTIFTFGYYGYVKAKKNFEEHELKKRISLSELLLGLMLVVPIFSAFFIVSELWFRAFDALEMNQRYELLLDDDEEFASVPLVELVFIIPESFFYFMTIHAILGVAYIQHSNLKDSKSIWRVLLFGFYALDWNPHEHIETNKSEPDDAANASNAASVDLNQSARIR